jgi:hypothetical protein
VISVRIAPGAPADSGYVFRVNLGFYPETVLRSDSFELTVLEQSGLPMLFDR